MVLPLRHLLALLIALVLALTGAVTVASQAHAAGAQSTRLSIVVTGCDTCWVRLIHATRTDEWYSPRRKIGSDGLTAFNVPTSKTRGMSIEVTASWEAYTGSRNIAAFKYAGHRAGSTLSLDDVLESPDARGCWAGTTAATQTLRMRVAQVETYDIETEDTGYEIVSWMNPQTRAIGPYIETYGGRIGMQDVLVC